MYAANGSFPQIPKTPCTRTLSDILEPAGRLNLDDLLTDRQYVPRPNYTPQRGGAHARYYTGTHSAHNYACDTDGVCPTLTQTPTVLFDDQIGDFRRMNLTETAKAQSLPPHFQFPKHTSEAAARKHIGKGMDGSCVRALGEAVSKYLRHGATASPHAFAMAPLALHEAHGHLCPRVSRLKGIPYPKEGCPICPYGKIKNAPATGVCRAKEANPLDCCFMDIKVCSVADRNDTLYCLGIIDSCTGKSWVFDLQSLSTEAVIEKLDHWRVQHLHNRQVKKLVMDNGSCFTSRAMKSYLTSVGIVYEYSGAYHQHQNGPAESLWYRLTSLCIMQMMQSAWLGVKYWFECMRHANDQLCRAPSRSHDNNCPQDLWDNFINGKITENSGATQRRWGTVCYVVEPSHSNFEPRGTKAYLLNYSEAHPGRCYDVLCANTNRVRKSVNVKFPDTPYADAVNAPDTIPLTFEQAPKTTPNAPPAPHFPPGTLAGLFNGANTHQSAVETSVPAANIRMTDVLRLGDISNCTSTHTRERCVQLHNKTVEAALETPVRHHSGALHVPKLKDIKYSISHGNLTAHRMHALHAATTSVPVVSNEEYVHPRTTRAEYITDDMGRDIASVAQLDPFATKYTFGVHMEVDGQTVHARFTKKTQPHTFHAQRGNLRGKTLPSQGNTVVASQREFDKLQQYERYNDILKAVATEYNGFDDRHIWTLEIVPPGEDLHDCLLLLKVKLNPDGTENKIKARCVIRGDRMLQGVHYTDTFAPASGLVAVRCLLSNTVTQGYCLKAFDAEQAFCNATPEFDTYLNPPPGRPRRRGPNGERMGYKLNRQTYGIPNGPRRWHMCIHNWMLRYNATNPGSPQWTQSVLEPCLYHLRGATRDERIDICLFVDDVLSSFPDTPTGRKTYSDFVEAFKKTYKIQDDGYTDADQFTGINLTWNADRTELRLDQPGAVDGVLKKYNFIDSKSSYTPAIANTLVSTRDCPAEGPEGDADRAYMKDKPYREAIGDLLWLARVYRYDIQYAVNACSRVGSNPGPAHWHAICKILRYLNHTKDFALVYRKHPQPKSDNVYQPNTTLGYSDSDWAPNYGTWFDNYRSTSGKIISRNQHALLWTSRRQERVAQSSCEAEYYAAASASKDLMFVDRIMQSLAPDVLDHPTPVLFLDNKSAIFAATNAQDNEKQRHIDLRAHCIRDSVTRKDMKLRFIPGTENPADAQTKPLGDTKFHKFRNFHQLVATRNSAQH